MESPRSLCFPPKGPCSSSPVANNHNHIIIDCTWLYQVVTHWNLAREAWQYSTAQRGSICCSHLQCVALQPYLSYPQYTVGALLELLQTLQERFVYLAAINLA